MFFFAILPSQYLDYLRKNHDLARIKGNNLTVSWSKKYDKIQLSNKVSDYKANLIGSAKKLSNFALVNVGCYNIYFTDCVFISGCSIDTCQLTNCKIVSKSFNARGDCLFTSCEILNGTFSGDGSSSKLVFDRCDIKAGIYKNVRFVNCVIDKSKCKIDKFCQFE